MTALSPERAKVPEQAKVPDQVRDDGERMYPTHPSSRNRPSDIRDLRKRPAQYPQLTDSLFRVPGRPS